MSQEHVSNTFEKFRLWIDPTGLVSARPGGTGSWTYTALMVIALRRQGTLPEWLEEGLGQVLLNTQRRPETASELAAFWVVAGNAVVQAPWRTLLAKLGAPSSRFFWCVTMFHQAFLGNWAGVYCVLEVCQCPRLQKFFSWWMRRRYTDGLGQFLAHPLGRAHPLTQLLWRVS